MGAVHQIAPDRLDVYHKAVLGVLADHADDIDGGSCYPSLLRIAFEASLGITKAKAVLKALRSAGFVTWELSSWETMKGRHREYRLNVLHILDVAAEGEDALKLALDMEDAGNRERQALYRTRHSNGASEEAVTALRRRYSNGATDDSNGARAGSNGAQATVNHHLEPPSKPPKETSRSRTIPGGTDRAAGQRRPSAVELARP